MFVAYFGAGGYIANLASDDTLDEGCAKIFRLKDVGDTFGKPLRLHKHQAEAIEIARRRFCWTSRARAAAGSAGSSCCERA